MSIPKLHLVLPHLFTKSRMFRPWSFESRTHVWPSHRPLNSLGLWMRPQVSSAFSTQVYTNNGSGVTQSLLFSYLQRVILPNRSRCRHFSPHISNIPKKDKCDHPLESNKKNIEADSCNTKTAANSPKETESQYVFNQFTSFTELGKRKPDDISRDGKEGEKKDTEEPPRKKHKKGTEEGESEKQMTTASMETTHLNERLKKLSEIIHTIEGNNCPDTTASVYVLNLFSFSQTNFEDGRKKAGRGVLLLKEGLSLLIEAEKQLNKDSKPEE